MVTATRQLDAKVTTRRHTYDGLNRRVSKTLGDPSSPTSTTDYYYNTNWQIIEAYEGSTLVEQNVWGLDYIDTPVLMRLFDAATSSLVGRRALFDANRHITALLGDGSNAAAVVERYAYDPYGQVLFMDGSFTIDTTQTASDFGNEVLFTGMRYNPETGTYQVRDREWHPALGRWMQRDPLGYVDGMNLYAGYFVMGQGFDPSGNKTWYVQTASYWEIDVWGHVFGWWNGYKMKRTFNSAKFDTKDNCCIDFNRSLDTSSATHSVKFRERFIWQDISYNTYAVGDVSSQACDCKGKTVDGITVNVYHVMEAAGTATINVGVAAGAEIGITKNAKVTAKVNVGVTLPPGEKKSEMLWTYLVCPTGDSADKPSVVNLGVTQVKWNYSYQRHHSTIRGLAVSKTP